MKKLKIDNIFSKAVNPDSTDWQACKVCKQSKNPIGLAVWGALQEERGCLDFAVMSGFQFFQSLACGIVENIVHGTG